MYKHTERDRDREREIPPQLRRAHLEHFNHMVSEEELSSAKTEQVCWHTHRADDSGGYFPPVRVSGCLGRAAVEARDEVGVKIARAKPGARDVHSVHDTAAPQLLQARQRIKRLSAPLVVGVDAPHKMRRCLRNRRHQRAQLIPKLRRHRLKNNSGPPRRRPAGRALRVAKAAPPRWLRVCGQCAGARKVCGRTGVGRRVFKRGEELFDERGG